MRTPSTNWFEAVESRLLFAAPTLAALSPVTLGNGAPVQVPLDGADADNDALTYTVTSSNPAVVATLSPNTNRSLKIVVNHTSSGASDPAFTGTMILNLFENRVPATTARIIALAQSGFYNNLTFHRVIPNFVIQGGDPLGNGTGGSGTDFDDEFRSDLQFTGSGQLAMAKSYDDTNDSQFFITEGPQRSLDFNHTIFGQLIEGETLREQISNVARDANDKPINPVTMTSVTVINDTQNRVLSLSTSATSGPSTITVTAKDPSGGTAVRTFTVTAAADTFDDPPILGPIADVATTANTPVTFNLTATDVEGSATAYLNWVGLYNNFSNTTVPVRLVPPDNQPPSGPRDVLVDVNFNTGVTTVTPQNSVAGVFSLYLGAAQTTAAFDSQLVPLFISPAAPTSIDLLDASDTGTSPTDNITRLNNANANAKLQFLVSGVLPGADVTLYNGNAVIGTGTVAAGQTSITITTNGSSSMANGIRSITATQQLTNINWHVGNESGVKTLTSVASSALALTVDTVAPTQTVTPVFNYKTAKPNLVFTFSENVAPSLTPDDLNLTSAGASIPPANLAVTYNAANNQATFTFPGYPNGSLPDGNYSALLTAGAVTDVAGNPVASVPALTFFSLAGDANHDRTVDFNDLVLLAQNYNTTGKTFDQGDFTYDGAVDFNDLVLLAQRYNTNLPAPAQPIFAPAPTQSPAKSMTATPSNPLLKSTQPIFSVTPVKKPTTPRTPKPKH